MVQQKQLMQFTPQRLKPLIDKSETGMGFYIVESSTGWIAILENGDAMPLYSDQTYCCLNDLLSGVFISDQRQPPPPIQIFNAFPSRSQAHLSLSGSPIISPTYVGKAGAIPLIASVKLPVCTMFVRYISSLTDHRFDPVTKILKKDTYLTSQLDRHHADTGFGSVGRYALPLPMPISTVIEYTLPVGTDIEVGTVAPLFGQAGGGVEIKLVNDTVVHQGFIYPLPPY